MVHEFADAWPWVGYVKGHVDRDEAIRTVAAVLDEPETAGLTAEHVTLHRRPALPHERDAVAWWADLSEPGKRGAFPATLVQYRTR